MQSAQWHLELRRQPVLRERAGEQHGTEEEGVWNMVCFDTADLCSHPGGADGHFKTSAIAENPFECPGEAL